MGCFLRRFLPLRGPSDDHIWILTDLIQLMGRDHAYLFHYTSQILHFYKLKVSGKSAPFFQQHLLSLCLCVMFGNSHSISKFSLLLVAIHYLL